MLKSRGTTSNEDCSLSNQCLKTKLCKFYPKCARGQTCPFAHSDKELRNGPNFKKSKLCAGWRDGRCKLPPSECGFAHGPDDLDEVAHNDAPPKGAATAPNSKFDLTLHNNANLCKNAKEKSATKITVNTRIAKLANDDLRAHQAVKPVLPLPGGQKYSNSAWDLPYPGVDGIWTVPMNFPAGSGSEHERRMDLTPTTAASSDELLSPSWPPSQGFHDVTSNYRLGNLAESRPFKLDSRDLVNLQNLVIASLEKVPADPQEPMRVNVSMCDDGSFGNPLTQPTSTTFRF